MSFRIVSYVVVFNFGLILIHDLFFDSSNPNKSLAESEKKKADLPLSAEVNEWLDQNGLSDHASLFREKQITNLFQCSLPEVLPNVGASEDQKQLEDAARKLQKLLIMKYWLKVDKLINNVMQG